MQFYQTKLAKTFSKETKSAPLTQSAGPGKEGGHAVGGGLLTLQVLEEYLRDFAGCVIVVSHDRYFMDKIVDHLLVFNGQGDIRDFPGNYTQYREWKEVQARTPSNSPSMGRTPTSRESWMRLFCN